MNEGRDCTKAADGEKELIGPEGEGQRERAGSRERVNIIGTVWGSNLHSGIGGEKRGERMKLKGRERVSHSIGRVKHEVHLLPSLPGYELLTYSFMKMFQYSHSYAINEHHNKLEVLSC